MKRYSVLFTLCCVFTIFLGCQKDPVENKVPVANAGPSASTTLPADSVRLTGTGTDADGSVVAFLWSQVSGPSSSIIVNPGSPSTSIRGLKQGNYVFQLMVTDNKGATGVDTVSVAVSAPLTQTTTLQPANNPFEVELVNYNGQDQSHSGAPDMPVAAWTKNGLPITIRELIKFDLSAIPATAKILSANLTLYTYPPPTLNGNFTDANFGTSNALYIQQVTSNWTNTSVNWFNQPSVSTSTQITAPAVGQTPQDLNVDVTSLVTSMVNNNSNYGFLVRLVTETTYNSRIYVSSYNTTHTSKRPKLVVTYQ